MQQFAKDYIDKVYKNESCYKCNKPINSDNTTLKSIISGSQKYKKPTCESCSKGGTVFVVKGDEPEEKSIGSEAVPSTVFTVRQHYRISPTKQNKVAVKPFKKRKFL